MTLGSNFEHSGLLEELRQRPRVLDFMTLEGLERLTGQTPDRFVLFMVKELVDNALDKRAVRNIGVEIRKDGDSLTLSVSDDGRPTLNREMLLKILDFERAPSSKWGFKTIRRGVLGNALQCCLGISYAMWRNGRPEYTAEVLGEGRFKIGLSPRGGRVEASIYEEPRDGYGTTTLLFRLPLHDYVSPFDVLRTIAMLNPHVRISYTEGEFGHTFEAEEGEPPPADSIDVHFYSFADFHNLVDELRNLPVGGFITTFRGLKNRSYARSVLQAAGIEPGLRLSELSVEQVKELYTAMRRKAKPISASRLPIAGKNAFERFGSVKYAVRRGVGKDDEGRYIPFAVEAASFASRREEFMEAINFTASINRPFTKWVWVDGDRKTQLYDLIKGKGVSVLIHLVCPNITWLSPAKGEMDVTPFRDAIFSVVRSVFRLQDTASEFDYERTVELVNEIMDSYPELDFTVRQIFYRLIARYGYPSTKSAYKKLVETLVRAREEDLVDVERIVDLSRPEYLNDSKHQSFRERLVADLNAMVEGFDLNRWLQQPVYLEVWIEKEALARVIYPVCKRYRVNLIVGRGYSSDTQIRRAVERFPDGKRTVILYLGDHDNTGLHIQESLKNRLLMKAYKRHKELDLEVRRIALTYDQIKQYNLPPSPLKKAGQKWREYRMTYGDCVWELDALNPEDLLRVVEDEVEKLIDWQIWDARELEVERYRRLLSGRVKMLLEKLDDQGSGGA